MKPQWTPPTALDTRAHDVRQATICNRALRRWSGSLGKFEELTPSHCSLVIRLWRPDESTYLKLGCNSPEWISGPVHWTEHELEVTPPTDEQKLFRVECKRNQILILTYSIDWIFHTVPGPYKPG